MKTTHQLSLASIVMLGLLTGCVSDGEDGAQGIQGEQGVQGEQGAQGIAGVNGQNAYNGVSATLIGRAQLGADSPEGAAEIVQYHAATQTLFAINSSGDATVEMIDISGLSSEALSSPISADNLTETALTLPTSYTVDGTEVALGDANSISIHGDFMAVAMAADAHADNGAVVFFNGLNAGVPAILSTVEAGNLPDMVTFTPERVDELFS